LYVYSLILSLSYNRTINIKYIYIYIYIYIYLYPLVSLTKNWYFRPTPPTNLRIEEVTRSSSSRLSKDKIPARHSFAGSTTTEGLKRRDLDLEKELRNLKWKGVQTSSQVSHPCYTADTQPEEEESQGGNISPTECDFIVETVVDPQLCTLRKPFKINYKRLNKDIESEANLERRRVYRERLNLEQKKEILSHYEKHISQVETKIFYFDFVDEFYPVENKVQTISKEKWVKEDNTVVSLSHPPQETIVFKHRTTTLKSLPL